MMVAAGLKLSGHKKVGMGDRRATLPLIVKTVYLLRRKNCPRFGLDFSIFLLCQVTNPNEIKTRHFIY